MYQKGDLKITKMPCETMDADGYCDTEYDDEHTHVIGDFRGRKNYIAPELAVYLPHSCDEWVIGGVAEIELMVADLQNALSQIKSEGK
jgi:hypothetical protein